jgi:hypothetical protein
MCGSVGTWVAWARSYRSGGAGRNPGKASSARGRQELTCLTRVLWMRLQKSSTVQRWRCSTTGSLKSGSLPVGGRGGAGRSGDAAASWQRGTTPGCRARALPSPPLADVGRRGCAHPWAWCTRARGPGTPTPSPPGRPGSIRGRRRWGSSAAACGPKPTRPAPASPPGAPRNDSPRPGPRVALLCTGQPAARAHLSITLSSSIVIWSILLITCRSLSGRARQPAAPSASPPAPPPPARRCSRRWRGCTRGCPRSRPPARRCRSPPCSGCRRCGCCEAGPATVTCAPPACLPGPQPCAWLAAVSVGAGPSASPVLGAHGLDGVQVQLGVGHRAREVDAAAVLLAELDAGRLLVEPDAKALQPTAPGGPVNGRWPDREAGPRSPSRDCPAALPRRPTSSSCSMSRLCVSGLRQSSTMRMRLQVRAVEMTCGGGAHAAGLSSPRGGARRRCERLCLAADSGAFTAARGAWPARRGLHAKHHPPADRGLCRPWLPQ